MSNLTTLGLIAAITIGATFVSMYIDRWIHDRTDAIVTGAIRGVQLSTRHRSLLFFNSWLPLVFTFILFTFVTALAFIGIAQNVGNVFVQSLAYICAVGFGFGCAIWLLMGTSWILLFRSALREAKSR